MEETELLGIENTEIRHQEISYNKLLLFHLNRISELRAKMTAASLIDENIYAFISAVDTLENLLFPYFNKDTEAQLADLEKLFPDATDADVGEDAIFIKDKTKANHYCRKKLQILMVLMRRINILLTETAPAPVLEIR